MKNAHWQTHLFYLTLLTIVVYFTQQKPSGVSESAWRQVFQSQKNIAERERLAADVIFNEIKIKHDRAPGRTEKWVDSLAVATQNELDELALTLQNAIQELLSHSGNRPSPVFWEHHAASLIRQIRKVKQEYPTRAALPDISYNSLLGIENEQVVLESALKNASAAEILLYLHAQQTNTEILRHAMMQHFHAFTKDMGRWGYQFKIIMDAPKLFAQKDKPWEARFYLCPAGTDAQNLTFEVSGKRLPHQSNGVYFQTIFHQTGEHQLPVRAVVRHPGTGASNLYEADFFVPVY